ncbi:MAG: hypothetical protein Q7W45_12870 [Bacteroidota bacterium]|nr:hypothetical protein [Bacteroidota bacterium]MDP3146779.1 hypothetical protein [Bacteroidota bacterium]
MTEQKIYYRKVRDLGGIFTAAFGFIKQNFKPFYGSLLFLAGPFIIVGSAISAYMMGSSMTFTRLVRNFDSFYGNLLISYFFSMMFIFIGVTVYNVILNKNLIENEKLQNHESLTINHSITGFFSDFWRILGNTLLLVVVSILALLFIGLIFAGLFALTGGNAKSGGFVILMVLLVILIFVALLLFGPILSFVPMASLFVCQRDRIGIFAAIKKVFYYLKGNFWMTWVVSLVGIVSYMVMGFIVQIPVLIITLATTFSRAKSTIAYGQADDTTPLLLVAVIIISNLLSYGVMSVYYLMTVYQYTNLEEKKEGSAIIEKINQIQ